MVPTSALEPIATPSAVYPASDVAPPYAEEPSKFEWSDLSPGKMVEDIKQATGLGPDEAFARTPTRRGEDPVGAQELRRGGRPVQDGGQALARLGDRGRRPVHAGRELLLRRPVSQGARRLRQRC